MSKKYGLGKGLGALIPEQDSSEVENNETILKIPLNLIKANKEQPRKNFDGDKIMELAQSIKQYGIIQPLVLKRQGGSYVIIAGERRWRAAKVVGVKEVPAVVMNMPEKEVLEVSLIENIQREDLNPIEEAKAYKRLIEEFNLTQSDVSSKIGKSRTAIANCMRLLNLDERVQQYLIDEVISEGHGRALLSLEDKDLQYSLAQKIIDENLSVREIEKLIRSVSKNTQEIKKQAADANPYYEDIKNRLEGYFGTKVFIKNNKNNKGKIEIEYYSEDDLQRIIDILNMQ
ncbi:ParB/RepB/Spo0J family partition protein [Clostridium sp. KNHs214]|uniref:ParB/RepB/Spo0J family partition protein n=1 Tax=Clostridium sp. KNHs214 TaxID=1540257 RepID=UPI000558683A|nr:ParB/RepB/Spo0J family partition protein [Clostridium sp. KNHs214]